MNNVETAIQSEHGSIHWVLTDHANFCIVIQQQIIFKNIFGRGLADCANQHEKVQLERPKTAPNSGLNYARPRSPCPPHLAFWALM
jgi:hypothetical protein